MRGPRLTRVEVAAILHREVSKCVSLGTERQAAIGLVAKKHSVDRERVAELVASVGRIGGGL
jgi:hypothetical protein